MSVNRISPEDLMALSAYLDGALDPPERSSLERRLATEPLLRAELDSLRDTVNLVKSLPRLKAPRDFTLTPAMLAQTSGGSSVSHSPKIIRLARFNRWQVASIATLAASILVVFIGLFAGFDNTASEDMDANEAYQDSVPDVNGEAVVSGISKPTFTPALDLSSAMRNGTTTSASSAPGVSDVMGTQQPSGAVEGSDSAEGPAPVPPPSQPTGLLGQTGSEDEADEGYVAATQVAQSPVSPSAAIPQTNGQAAGSAANNPTAETMTFAVAPTATAQPSLAATSTSATKVAEEARPDDTTPPSNEPAVEPAPETGRAEFDESADEDEGFEINVLLVVGLVGIIASILALGYTWRRR
ncbi:MAG: hypothetical protein DPW16_17270 [Chloroflexi bacterium]|nr:hypothetical protein [Chloroflexota bacterium]